MSIKICILMSLFSLILLKNPFYLNADEKKREHKKQESYVCF